MLQKKTYAGPDQERLHPIIPRDRDTEVWRLVIHAVHHLHKTHVGGITKAVGVNHFKAHTGTSICTPLIFYNASKNEIYPERSVSSDLCVTRVE